MIVGTGVDGGGVGVGRSKRQVALRTVGGGGRIMLVF